jgi:hypothetical protein
MKRMRITLSFLIFAPAVTLALAASAAAQTVVVGTGNPHIDVPAVQAAVVRVPVERDHGFRWKMIAQSGGT